MGLGTKIKDALHGDKEQQHSTTDTSKTPGSFPSDEVPRSHTRKDPVGSDGVGTSSQLNNEKLPGSKPAEYTYGSSTGPTATSGVTGRHNHGVTGTHQDSGLAHQNVPGTTATSTGSSHAQKHPEPYWGETERAGRHEPGLEGGAYERSGEALHAHDVNNRYNNTKHHDNFAHDSTAGRSSAHNTNLSGTTGAHGSEAPEGTRGPHTSRVANAADPRVDSDRDHRGAPGTSAYASGQPGSTGYGSAGTSEGVHGPHSSRVANTADPRVDSDRDHRGAPGTSTYASGQPTTGTGHPGSAGYGSAGTAEGLHGPHTSRVANTADPRVDSDRDHRGAPGSTGYSSGTQRTYGEDDRFNAPAGTHTTTSSTTGTTSNLTSRPHNGSNSLREEKIRDYDAPTNSSDRGIGGSGAGLVGGAAAGLGASKLANHHHQEDLRENGSSYGASRGNDAHGSIGSRERLSSTGTGLEDPHAFNTATKPGTGAGTSMLDPHGTSSGHHVGNHAGAATGNSLGSGSHLQGSRGPYAEREGHTGAYPHEPGSNLQHGYNQQQVPSAGTGYGQSHNNSTGLTNGSNTDAHGQSVSGIGHNNVGRSSAAHDAGLGRGENTSGGSSSYSQEGSGVGSEHFVSPESYFFPYQSTEYLLCYAINRIQKTVTN